MSAATSLDVCTSGKLAPASQFAKALRASGVAVTGKTSIGRTPAGAHLLTSVKSPDLATIVNLTDQPSDNFYAETLLKESDERLRTVIAAVRTAFS